MGKSMTIEEAIKRLEEISGKMEGDISIDESISLYSEAVKLINITAEKLNLAKQKVKKLSEVKEKDNGTI